MKKVAILLLAALAAGIWWFVGRSDRSDEQEAARSSMRTDDQARDTIAPLGAPVVRSPGDGARVPACTRDSTSDGERSERASGEPGNRTISGRVVFLDGSPFVENRLSFSGVTSDGTRSTKTVGID